MWLEFCSICVKMYFYVSVLLTITITSEVRCHWETRAEHICMEAAKNTTYDPLCASNGQTYQNYITFQCFRSYFNVPGLSWRRGACLDNPEPDHCVLAFVVWRRVCGSDNVTYSSIWELMCEAQKQQNSILLLGNTVQYEGPCRVQCPMTLEYKPVCSSENADYPNLEALRCAALRKPHLANKRNKISRWFSEISLKKEGLCASKDIPAYICQPKKKGSYSEREKPICANNGVTYATYNALACLRLYNEDIRVLHDGPCRYEDIDVTGDARKICSLADNNAVMMPVCGTDNVTYPNPFVLNCAIYRKVVPADGYLQLRQCLVFADTIKRVGAACEQSDSPCEKLRVAPEALVSDPICGSDGTSYANPLALMCAIMSEPSK
ncbi:hypothetical protein C0J52_05837 [Blattella germanica]|nr:hypothetical protein C0J52_05837 [Blattella germanica]